MMRMRTYTNGGYGVKGIDPAGGTMTLPLRLVLTPGTPMDAVTKGYVDNAASSFTGSTVLGTFNSARLPGWSGSDISSAGGVFTLSTTGVGAGTYSKVTVDDRGRVTAGGSLTTADIPDLSWSKITGKPSTLAGYGITDVVSLNGGTMTGALTLGASVTGSTQLATKAYVDITIGNSGSSPFVVGDIVYKSTAVTPSGFLRCNGGAVSKTTYSGLYSVVNDTYTGSTTQPGAGQPWRQQYDINTEQSGDITTWTTGTALPGTVSHSQSIVTKNRVYLLGGLTGSDYSSTVYTAPINTDGTLGTWTTGTVLPGTVSHSQPIVTKNRVYLLGGQTGGAYSSTVYTAPISADGTLGTWTTGTSLPGAVAYSQSIVTKNRVYLLGGYTGSAYSSAVYTAPISTDGTLGTWTTGTALPGTVGHSQSIVTKNRVYLLGGYSNGAHSSTVYTAPISGGLNDYSPYYDGTVTPTDINNFNLPDLTTKDKPGSYSYIKY